MKFLERQYKEEVLEEKVKKVDRIERKQLLTNKEKKQFEFHDQQHTTEHSLTYLKL